MPRKRLLLEAHAEGERVDDDELRMPSQANRALKKSKRAQRSDDDRGNEAMPSLGATIKKAPGDARDSATGKHSNASSRSADTDSGEEAGGERTSNSEDGGDLQELDRHRNQAAVGGDVDAPAHAQSISGASASAPKYTENQQNKDVDNGRSDSESVEDLSEDEEMEEETLPGRKRKAKGEAYGDSSQSSGSSSDGDSGEEGEELDDGEQRSNESTAFGRAFQKIMRKKLPSTALAEAMGPMLSSHKQLVTKKLEEAAEGRKAKIESKKEKQALREKGHTVPALFPVAKDKELLKLATRGVVKLFNAVSKAQSVQEAAVFKASEAKDVAKRSKSTFLAMLQGGNGALPQSLNSQRQPSDSKKEGVADGQPGWSALRDTFMLGKSRLKDWDKKEEDAADLKGAGSSGDDSDSSD